MTCFTGRLPALGCRFLSQCRKLWLGLGVLQCLSGWRRPAGKRGSVPSVPRPSAGLRWPGRAFRHRDGSLSWAERGAPRLGTQWPQSISARMSALSRCPLRHGQERWPFPFAKETFKRGRGAQPSLLLGFRKPLGWPCSCSKNGGIGESPTGGALGTPDALKGEPSAVVSGFPRLVGSPSNSLRGIHRAKCELKAHGGRSHAPRGLPRTRPR